MPCATGVRDDVDVPSGPQFAASCGPAPRLQRRRLAHVRRPLSEPSGYARHPERRLRIRPTGLGGRTRGIAPPRTPAVRCPDMCHRRPAPFVRALAELELRTPRSGPSLRNRSSASLPPCRSAGVAAAAGTADHQGLRPLSQRRRPHDPDRTGPGVAAGAGFRSRRRRLQSPQGEGEAGSAPPIESASTS